MAAFVGRAAELEALTRCVSSRGGPVGALVVGESGSGKSRLFAEVRARTPRLQWLPVVGFEAEQSIPLAAASGLLRTLAARPGAGQALASLLRGTGVASETTQSAGRVKASGLEPLQVFEAAARSVATTQPAALIVDDVQWLDELSFSLCHYLLRAATDAGWRLACLVAARPGARGEELLELLPAEQVTRLELGPLQADAGMALARSVDPRLDPSAARAVWERARGLPFWIEALARHPSDEAIEQVLTRRLRGAGVDPGLLLGCLALCGQPMSLAAAASVLAWPAARGQTALGVLVERGLAVEQRGLARAAHDIVRATAARQLSDDARVRLHRRLAAHFERAAVGDVQVLLRALVHRRAGGLPVLPQLRRLVRSPQRRLLGADGISELAAFADELEATSGEATSDEAVSLQADVGTLLHEIGRYEEAQARWSLVGERSPSAALRATAWLNASRAAYELGRPDDARALLALSRAQAISDEVLALEQLTHEAAICLWLERRTAEGRRLVADAAARARDLRVGRRKGATGSRARRAWLDALRLEYEAAVQRGEPQELLRAAEAWQKAARGASQEEVLLAFKAVAAALRQNGRMAEALTRFRRLWAETNRAVLPRLAVDAGFWLSRTLALAGHLRAAEAVVAETVELTRRVGDVPRARHVVAGVAANVWLERGRRTDGLALLERETAQQASEHQRITLHADRALWLARLEGIAADAVVRDQLAAAEACTEAVGCPRCAGELRLLTAEAMARIGDRTAALASVARRDELDYPLDDLDRLTRHHVRALSIEDPAQRAIALREALDAVGTSPYRLHAVWLRLDLGQALVETGRPQGTDELRTAADLGTTLGAETVGALAERSLRALGVRTWRRAAAGAPLTDREREVAELVVAGATNREVAAALLLSPKTVERHLVNLFRKLDVRNRTELAARIADRPTTGISR